MRDTQSAIRLGQCINLVYTKNKGLTEMFEEEVKELFNRISKLDDEMSENERIASIKRTKDIEGTQILPPKAQKRSL